MRDAVVGVTLEWVRWCVGAVEGRGAVRASAGLISVRGLAVRRAGDLMGDGVFPRDAVRPLGLWRPSRVAAAAHPERDGDLLAGAGGKR